MASIMYREKERNGNENQIQDRVNSWGCSNEREEVRENKSGKKHIKNCFHIDKNKTKLLALYGHCD